MFKENFIKFCNKRGESPSYVCKQVGITPATFSCWNEESKPRKATLMRIAEYFNVTVDDLLSDEEKPIQTNMGITISPFEVELLRAYWSKPEIREAVNKLLDINDKIIIYTAASSKTGTPDGYIAMTPEEWQKLKEAPETEDPLM